MLRQAKRIVLFTLVLLLAAGCAQMVPLSGGQRDMQPPRLLEAIPANGSLNFTGPEIILRFDEFVQLKDLNSQLIVTPALRDPPEVEAIGKKISIRLKKEQLSANTTYKLFLGSAIADMHESNSIPGFEFVFSTGPYIDSLSLNGIIVDALTTRPSAANIIGLYPVQSSDSIFFKEKPLYYTRSGASGEFTFSNLPPDSFRVFAFADVNRNLVYDGESEKAAFIQGPVSAVKDSTIRLRLFQEKASKVFIKRSFTPLYGSVIIISNRRTFSTTRTLDPAKSGNLHELNPGAEKDSVQIFYHNFTDTVKLVHRNLETGKQDTLNFPVPKLNSSRKKLQTYSHNLQGNILPPKEKMNFRFHNWMDTSYFMAPRISLQSKEDTSVAIRMLKGKWTSPVDFELDASLQEATTYTLKADSGAFRNLNGFASDSLLQSFRTGSHAELGKLTLKVTVNRKQEYLVQLLNEGGQQVAERPVSFSLSSSNSAALEFNDLKPGNYVLRLVYDDNGNKKWDTGSVPAQSLPERVFVSTKLIKLLSDWEVEEEVVIRNDDNE